MKLETGICGEQSVRVSAENTAKTMGSGTLDVFATPALVALAEKTCWQSVAPALEAGSGTVGTKLELEHTAPTPVGMTVTCHSELVAVEGRKLTFKVTLADEKGPVGGGTHERFIIFEEKFAAKAEAKKGAKDRPVLFRPAAAAASLRPSSCCSARVCASCKSCTACTLARNSSKVHGLVIRHGAHPLCISVGSLPRSLHPDTPDEPRRQ